MPTASRTGRIPNTEWPTIVARRQAGETYAAIARDYDVTGPAIKYIVDKAQAEAAPAAEPATEPAPGVDANVAADPAPETPRKKTISIAKAAPPEKAEDAPAPIEAAEPERAEDAPAPAAPAIAASADTPLARRLIETASECAALIAQAERGAAGIDEDVKSALHQVRRAVAAIEIEMSRAPAPPRPIPQGRRSAPVQSAPVRSAPRPSDLPNAIDRPSASDMPTDDGGGFGTHMVQGTVKFFHADKGFGFVIPDGGGSDIYVPLKALRGSGLDTLEAEQRVRVAVTRGVKGPEAKEIEPVAA